MGTVVHSVESLAERMSEIETQLGRITVELAELDRLTADSKHQEVNDAADQSLDPLDAFLVANAAAARDSRSQVIWGCNIHTQ